MPKGIKGFQKGHAFHKGGEKGWFKKGQKFSPEEIKKAAVNRWKGEKVGYRMLHVWVTNHLGKPDKCESCNTNGLTGHQIHWANKDGKYRRNLNDWVRLCSKCHNVYDKINKLKGLNVSRNPQVLRKLKGY